MLAADALVREAPREVSPVVISHRDVRPYHFVYPPHLEDWPPLVSLRTWLREEIEQSQRALEAATRKRSVRAR